MASIGTTIAPWMLFFQQSAVVDKGMKEKDIPRGKFDTFLGSNVTVIVAIFIVIVTGTILKGVNIDDAALVFLILLLNNKKTMGEYTNTLWQNIVTTTIVVVIIVISSLYGNSTLFPDMFK